MYNTNYLKFFIFLTTYLSGVDAILPDVKSMTLDQKIGQLFIAAAYSNPEDANLEGLKVAFVNYAESLVMDYHIGGLILKLHWTVEEEVIKIQEYQSKSQIPLFICQDFEWGLTQRLPNTLRFPQNMTLGAIQDVNLIEQMGCEVGRQCRAIGVNYNLAPCVDVNNNPLNPVIHLRSFGDNPVEVSKRGVAMMKGLQKSGVIACAKHFPGHGDTAADSHFALPMLSFSKERLYSIELEPFRNLIANGVMSVMVGHLCVPAFEIELDRPSSLSKTINRDLLQDELGFQGLVVTDDLLMKPVSERYGEAEACLQAFLAGNDLILTATTAIEGIHRIKQAVTDGLINEDEIDRRVAKILRAKAWILNQPRLDNSALFSKDALFLKKKLYESSLTLVKSKEGVLPLKPYQSRIAVLQIGSNTPSPFYQAICEFDQNVQLYMYDEQSLVELQDYQTLIVCYLGMNKFREQNYGLSFKALDCVKELFKTHCLIAVVFGTPYSLSLIPEADVVVMGYEDDPDAQMGCAKILFGQLDALGHLPINSDY